MSGDSESVTGAQPSELRRRLYGIKEAATYLGISVRSIERLLEKDEIPTVKLPGLRRILFRVEDLDQLIAEYVTDPREDPIEELLKRQRRKRRG